MKLLLAMDDAAANWYSYHFHDTLFLNDTSWVYWHIKLQELLNQQQLEGQACAFCGALAHDVGSSNMETAHIAGYAIVFCREPCHMTVE